MQCLRDWTRGMRWTWEGGGGALDEQKDMAKGRAGVATRSMVGYGILCQI